MTTISRFHVQQQPTKLYTQSVVWFGARTIFFLSACFLFITKLFLQSHLPQKLHTSAVCFQVNPRLLVSVCVNSKWC